MGDRMSKSAYNETGKDDMKPDQMDPFHDYAGSHSRHLSDEGGDLKGSVNSRSGAGINGGGTPGRGQPTLGGK